MDVDVYTALRLHVVVAFFVLITIFLVIIISSAYKVAVIELTCLDKRVKFNTLFDNVGKGRARGIVLLMLNVFFTEIELVIESGELRSHSRRCGGTQC